MRLRKDWVLIVEFEFKVHRGLVTEGAVEALANAEEMIASYLATAHEAGWTVPQPLGRLAFA